MVAIVHDGALRREELVQIEIDDLERVVAESAGLALGLLLPCSGACSIAVGSVRGRRRAPNGNSQARSGFHLEVFWRDSFRIYGPRPLVKPQRTVSKECLHVN